MKKRGIWILCAVVLLCLAAWGLSILRCEILTVRHGSEFDNAWKRDTMLIDPAYWKVLDYSESAASVYFVAPDKKGGAVLRFEKQEGNWVLSDWGPYWSATGSADDIIWPYIR